MKMIWKEEIKAFPTHRSESGLVINSNPDVFGSAAANGAPARDVRVFRLTSSSRPTF
jgi:hypothetical protein